MTLQVAELLKSPVAVCALKRTLLRVKSIAFFHRDQQSRDLVVFKLFKLLLNIVTIYILLYGLIPTCTWRIFLNIQLFELRCSLFDWRIHLYLLALEVFRAVPFPLLCSIQEHFIRSIYFIVNIFSAL